MGKASRRKRLRREASPNSSEVLHAKSEISKPLAPTIFGLYKPKNKSSAIIPEKIYRFFESSSFANDFKDGRIWISTLEKCRETEDAPRKDVGEAKHRFIVDELQVSISDPGSIRQARNLGIIVEGTASSGTIVNASATFEIKDAYVLCTTQIYSPSTMSKSFGDYCVEISSPTEFFRLVTSAINGSKGPHNRLLKSDINPVMYRSRDYRGDVNPREELGFVKPNDFRHEDELRMLWIPESNRSIKPFLLEVPEVSSLCKVLSPRAG